MIASVTLNPALDKVLYMPAVKAGALNRAARLTSLPGGKGVNMAVILNSLGQDVLALGFLGGFVGEFIEETLERQGISVAFEHIRETSRTSIILVEPDGRVTQILEPGPAVAENEIDRFLGTYDRSLGDCETVIVAGSLTPGAPADIYKKMLSLAKSKGLFTVLNAYGEAFAAGLEAGPDLVKPDVRFEPQVLGLPSDTRSGRRQIAERLLDRGAGVVAIAFDGINHALYTADTALEITVPPDRVAGAVIASDAFLAGLVDGLRRQRPLTEAAVWAVATEMAATLEPEKRLATPEEVSRWLSIPQVEELK